MRVRTLLASLIVATCALVEVSCITNQEFFELLKPYAEDLQSFDLDDPAIDDDDDGSNAIELPGNGDDELDVEYLMTQLDLADSIQGLQQTKATSPSNNDLGWWRRRRRRRRRPWRNPCKCYRYSCNCCLNHTFKINVIFKKWRFRVNACVKVAYLPRDRGFSISVTYNGRRVFHREISLRRPPALCYGVPGLTRFVRACVEIYNVNIRAKSLCVRLAAIINVRIKKFRFNLKIGCFRIPLADDLEGADAMRLLEQLQVSMEDTETGKVDEISLSELPALYRQLQVDMADKYENHEEEEGWGIDQSEEEGSESDEQEVEGMGSPDSEQEGVEVDDPEVESWELDNPDVEEWEIDNGEEEEEGPRITGTYGSRKLGMYRSSRKRGLFRKTRFQRSV